jgi:hypothetical protein
MDLAKSDRFRQIFTLSGEGGIRTHGGPKPTTVFETAPIVHSGTSPIREHYTKLSLKKTLHPVSRF